jgi:hypothetical protein
VDRRREGGVRYWNSRRRAWKLRRGKGARWTSTYTFEVEPTRSWSVTPAARGAVAVFGAARKNHVRRISVKTTIHDTLEVGVARPPSAQPLPSSVLTTYRSA